jgi:hypothetical protein
MFSRTQRLMQLLSWIHSDILQEDMRQRFIETYERELNQLQSELEEAKALKILYDTKCDVPLKCTGDVQDNIDASLILVEIQKTREKFIRKVFSLL